MSDSWRFPCRCNEVSTGSGSDRVSTHQTNRPHRSHPVATLTDLIAKEDDPRKHTKRKFLFAQFRIFRGSSLFSGKKYETKLGRCQSNDYSCGTGERCPATICQRSARLTNTTVNRSSGRS